MKPIIGLAAIAVVAVPIASSGSVAHADRVNWQAVAQCESSGNWSANTGNGAYGGLQIKPSTWVANGGAGLPSNASPQAQIQVAKRILATQGPGAWPTCMSRMRDQQDTVPVGTLTHFMMFLVDQLEAGAPPG